MSLNSAYPTTSTRTLLQLLLLKLLHIFTSIYILIFVLYMSRGGCRK